MTKTEFLKLHARERLQERIFRDDQVDMLLEPLVVIWPAYGVFSLRSL